MNRTGPVQEVAVNHFLSIYNSVIAVFSLHLSVVCSFSLGVASDMGEFFLVTGPTQVFVARVELFAAIFSHLRALAYFFYLVIQKETLLQVKVIIHSSV